MGRVRITDRKKDLIKTSGGKYIAPQAIEAQLKAICPIASQMIVHGDKRNFATALITLDADALPKWAAGPRDRRATTPSSPARRRCNAYVEQCVDELNTLAERWETIKQFRILRLRLQRGVRRADAEPEGEAQGRRDEVRGGARLDVRRPIEGEEHDRTLDVLVEGYADDRVAGTVSLVRDGDAVIVVDPGMVRDRSDILDPLDALGVAPDDVTDVVFSHHHPDHTLNAALFRPRGSTTSWRSTAATSGRTARPKGLRSVGLTLRYTPGHTEQDISTVVETEDGVVVLHPPVVECRGSRGRPVRAGPRAAVRVARAGPGPRPGTASSRDTARRSHRRADAALSRRPRCRTVNRCRRTALASSGPPRGGKPFGWYLHVPYCVTRCGYCDFNTYALGVDPEVEADGAPEHWSMTAVREMELAQRVLGASMPVADTVFFGGGTPTLLAC